MHGWIIVDKPLGMSSSQVVGRVRWLLRQAIGEKVKAGHGGTLDPLATGVLPIALGEATKLVGYVLDAPKSYRFTLRFGSETATGDAEGEVTATSDMRPTAADIQSVLDRFRGEIEQLPPAYSALKVDGKRAYARARAGETVDLEPRRVTIHALDALDLPDGRLDAASFDVRVSKGTYIRSLGQDIARALATVGHLSALRRTAAGPFDEAEAISLDKCAQLMQEGATNRCIYPLTAGLDDIPAFTVTPEEARRLRFGQRLPGPPGRTGLHLAKTTEAPVALVEIDAGGVRVVRGFNL